MCMFIYIERESERESDEGGSIPQRTQRSAKERTRLRPPRTCSPQNCQRFCGMIKVNLRHAINFRALCDANLVTLYPKFEGNKTRVVHRVV